MATAAEGDSVTALPMGRIASFYYLKYTTMAFLRQHLGPNMDLKVPSICKTFPRALVETNTRVELHRLASTAHVWPLQSPSPDTQICPCAVVGQALRWFEFQPKGVTN